MATELNQAHRNAILDATGDIFGGGSLPVYTGSRPGADNTATGTQLCEADLPASAFAAASNGSMASTGSWSASVSETGAPGYYRLLNSDGSQVREGDAAESPGSGEAMLFTDLVDGDLIQGGTVTFTYEISQPAGDSV